MGQKLKGGGSSLKEGPQLHHLRSLDFVEYSLRVNGEPPSLARTLLLYSEELQFWVWLGHEQLSFFENSTSREVPTVSF